MRLDRRGQRRGQPSSPAHAGAKFGAAMVRAIRRTHERGVPAREIARRLKVAPATIVNMVARRSYREVK